MFLILSLFIQVMTSVSQKPIAWCFGYGSLVDSYAERAKFVEVNIHYRRVWNARNTKARATFLGLECTDGKNKVTGVIYPIFTQEELAELDIREHGYGKQKIDLADVTVLNEGLNEIMQNTELDDSMEIFTYVPENAGDVPDAEYPILQSYVDLCSDGFLKFKAPDTPRDESDPLRKFIDTTFGWSKYMLNDRVLARR